MADQEDNALLPVATGREQFNPLGLGGILPFDFKTDPKTGHLIKGTSNWAVPSLVRGGVNAAYNMLTGPGEVLTGRNPVTGAPANPNPLSIANDTAMTLMGLGQTPLGGALPKGAMASFKGYHGTPHVFEPVEGNPFGAFRDSAIGSGEGAQVYGWGHYVAGAKETAEQYAEDLAKEPVVKFNGEPISENTLLHNDTVNFAENALRRFDGNFDQAIAHLNSHADSWPEFKGSAQWLKDNKDKIEFQPGQKNLLHVEIKPEEHQLGYDSIRYKNEHEDKGATSYMTLHPGQAKHVLTHVGATP